MKSLGLNLELGSRNTWPDRGRGHQGGTGCHFERDRVDLAVSELLRILKQGWCVGHVLQAIKAGGMYCGTVISVLGT